MSEAYFSNPALSRSDLRLIATNPAKWWKQRQGLLPREQPTKEMVFGSALDKMLCDGKGPDPLPDNWVLIPDEVLSKNGARAGNAYREWVAQFDGANVVLLTQRDVDRLQAESVEQRKALRYCVESVLKHTKAREYLLAAKGIRQKELYWSTDYPVDVKALPDVVIPGHVIVDLKTTSDISESAFLRKVFQYWYDVQAVMCQEGWEKCHGQALPVVWVVVQNQEPYDIAVFEVGDTIRQYGYLRYDRAVVQYMCRAHSDDWRKQGHGQVITLEAPRYWQYESEYQLDEVEGN